MFKACDTIYIVDPDESVHDALHTLLRGSGVYVVCFTTPEALLAANTAINEKRCCLLVEADLSGMGSLALIRKLHNENTTLPIVVLASTNDSGIAAQALKAGAIDVIDKPLIGVHLLDRILGAAASSRSALAHSL